MRTSLMDRFFRKAKPATDVVPASVEHQLGAGIEMIWRSDASLPIGDWAAMWERAPDDAQKDALTTYWTEAAHAWLGGLGRYLGPTYRVRSSDHFLVLSPLDERSRDLTLRACELMRKHILRALPGIAGSAGYGPHVVIIFGTLDAYYEYIANYYPEDGEYAQSSGMFLQNGYGHFVFVASEIANMEPVIAHELTHCLVMHLPLPAWLNEGIAVSMEKRLIPHLADPRNALYSPAEVSAKHAAFWNASTIQEFWSGKSFLRAGDGASLSYDLAERLVGLLSRNYACFVDFATSADAKDAGICAAQESMGVGLGEAASAVLGAGSWAPDPAAWYRGVERGQFRANISVSTWERINE